MKVGKKEIPKFHFPLEEEAGGFVGPTIDNDAARFFFFFFNLYAYVPSFVPSYIQPLQSEFNFLPKEQLPRFLSTKLYHHPISMDSQKVRLALEENVIDYTSYHVNPLTGKNMEPSFFRINPNAKLPVFKNGSHIIYDTFDIIQYIERIAVVSSGGDESRLSSSLAIEWMHKIQAWNPNYFTLSHVPENHRLFVSKFLRRVVIARMSEAPDLASAYHLRLKHAYDTEEKLKDPDVVRHSKEHLVRLLDEVEAQLKETSHVAGDDFTMADVMLIPVLARLALLKLEKEYIECRPNLLDYWNVVRQRPSYKKVIGKYFEGWKRKKTLARIWCFIHARSLLRRY